MKKLLFIIICISLFSFNSMAQIKVYQNGTIKLRGDRTTDDANDEVSAIVYGKYGTNLANGRLAIGDYGQMAQHGGNVFIGEYGTNIDSDILQLHGKYGYYLTRDIGNIVAYYKYSEGNKFNFNCDIYMNGQLLLTSDERQKNNIKKLDNSLAQLKKLEGVSYNLLFRENTNLEKGSPVTEKEKKSKQEYDEATAKHIEALAAKKRLGFIAQDVQKVFPELVEQDSAGNLSMDYIGIIPILVEAVKELEARIETIESDCCNKDENLKIGSIQNNESAGSLGEPKLYQNAPNPFSVQTSIRFEIPASVQNTQLHICNMVGTLIKSIPINHKGEGNVTINANEFAAGMYLYSLVCDGKIIDTKQMMLTN